MKKPIYEKESNPCFRFNRLSSFNLRVFWLNLGNFPILAKYPLTGDHDLTTSPQHNLAMRKDRKARLSHQARSTNPSLIAHVGTCVHAFLWKSTIAFVNQCLVTCRGSALRHLRDFVLESRLDCLDDILICLAAYK